MFHEEHPGIVRMKALMRDYVWWPKMDTEVERCVNACTTCQATRKEPPKAPLLPWERTRNPWTRLHMDFAGPFRGQTFLVVVDSYSKWLEVFPMASTTSRAVIGELRKLFATHGLPQVIVSDNGTAFNSEEMRNFAAANGIRLSFIPAYHPASNEQAECMVQETKNN
ncbi:hypothetical protein DMN91_002597 [Ooceraea biroi]|nr:hypothetical protein DMN91_002597 [Ooceraea biroi]